MAQVPPHPLALVSVFVRVCAFMSGVKYVCPLERNDKATAARACWLEKGKESEPPTTTTNPHFRLKKYVNERTRTSALVTVRTPLGLLDTVTVTSASGIHSCVVRAACAPSMMCYARRVYEGTPVIVLLGSTYAAAVPQLSPTAQKVHEHCQKQAENKGLD